MSTTNEKKIWSAELNCNNDGMPTEISVESFDGGTVSLVLEERSHRFFEAFPLEMTDEEAFDLAVTLIRASQKARKASSHE